MIFRFVDSHVFQWAKAYSAVKFAMVEAYWNIGKIIVEKQGGVERAEYGVGLLKELAKQLTVDFGKDFTIANLSYPKVVEVANHYSIRSGNNKIMF